MKNGITKLYGKGFDRVTLYRCYRFYNTFLEIVATLWQQSEKVLSWSHYSILIQVEDKKAKRYKEMYLLSTLSFIETTKERISKE